MGSFEVHEDGLDYALVVEAEDTDPTSDDQWLRGRVTLPVPCAIPDLFLRTIEREEGVGLTRPNGDAGVVVTSLKYYVFRYAIHELVDVPTRERIEASARTLLLALGRAPLREVLVIGESKE